MMVFVWGSFRFHGRGPEADAAGGQDREDSHRGAAAPEGHADAKEYQDAEQSLFFPVGRNRFFAMMFGMMGHVPNLLADYQARRYSSFMGLSLFINEIQGQIQPF
jgi:hypothetical protein